MRHLGRSLTGWARSPVRVWYWVWRQWSSGGPFSGASSPLTRLGVSTGRREVGEGGRSAGSILAKMNAGVRRRVGQGCVDSKGFFSGRLTGF